LRIVYKDTILKAIHNREDVQQIFKEVANSI